MDVLEILEKEQANNNRIFAYREGSYWRAYEMSVYSLYKIACKQKPVKYEINGLKGDYIYFSMGRKDLERICRKQELVRRTDNFIEYNVPWVSNEEFCLWKYNIKMNDENALLINPEQEMLPQIQVNEIVAQENKKEQNHIDIEHLIREIKEFPLETKTPMECMNWCLLLKKMVNV